MTSSQVIKNQCTERTFLFPKHFLMNYIITKVTEKYKGKREITEIGTSSKQTKVHYTVDNVREGIPCFPNMLISALFIADRV